MDVGPSVTLLVRNHRVHPTRDLDLNPLFKVEGNGDGEVERLAVGGVDVLRLVSTYGTDKVRGSPLGPVTTRPRKVLPSDHVRVFPR